MHENFVEHGLGEAAPYHFIAPCAIWRGQKNISIYHFLFKNPYRNPKIIANEKLKVRMPEFHFDFNETFFKCRFFTLTLLFNLNIFRAVWNKHLLTINKSLLLRLKNNPACQLRSRECLLCQEYLLRIDFVDSKEAFRVFAVDCQLANGSGR